MNTTPAHNRWWYWNSWQGKDQLQARGIKAKKQQHQVHLPKNTRPYKHPTKRD